ncbi:alpha/beta fold hydrolase [Lacisediminihabitans sp. FW035]
MSTGIRLHWRFDGDAASTLVLLNPIGTDMGLWDATMPHLLSDFQVLRIDTRGHGASNTAADDFSLSLLAQDVRRVMDDADVDRAVIAGVSLGGMIAMELALDSPDRVAALALICTSAEMDATMWADRVTQVREGGMAGVADVAASRFLSPEFIALHPDTASRLHRALLTMNPAGYVGAAAAIRDMTLLDRLDQICVPTVVIAGSRDVSTPLDEHGALIASRISGARTILIDSAHLAPIEAPEDLGTIIRDLGTYVRFTQKTDEWSNDA